MSVPINDPEPDTDEPYVTIARLRQEIEVDPQDVMEEHNEFKRFDDLLERLATVATSIIDNATGDQTWHRETDRVDVIKVPPSSSMLNLVYPIVEVTKVERLVKGATEAEDEWEEIDRRRYDETKHGLRLFTRRSSTRRSSQSIHRDNPLVTSAERIEWSAFRQVRVTYTRGYETIPENIQEICVKLVERMLRNKATQQNLLATNPEDIEGNSEMWDTVLSEPLAEQIDGLQSLGMSTFTA